MSKSFKLTKDAQTQVEFCNVTCGFKVSKNSKDGKKRDNFTVSFPAITEFSDEINLILNEAISAHVKVLIQDNSENWNYKPSKEELTIKAISEYISKPSQRGQRILTKDNIKTWASFYSTQVIEKLGKSQPFAVTVTTLAEDKFSKLIGMNEKIAKVLETLESEVIISELVNYPDNITEIHTALIEKLIEISEVKKLELNLENLE